MNALELNKQPIFLQCEDSKAVMISLLIAHISLELASKEGRERYSHLSLAFLKSSVVLVCDFVQSLVKRTGSGEQCLPELVNAMFLSQFHCSLGPETSPSIRYRLEDPILRGLITISEIMASARDGHSFSPEDLNGLRSVRLLLFLIGHSLNVADVTHQSDCDLLEIVSPILYVIHIAWQKEKTDRQRITVSPLPWSNRSRREGYPPPNRSFPGLC